MSDLVERIARAQRQLVGMRDFHRVYLDRRKARGISTGTDEIMERYQVQIGDCLDLLEAIKAIMNSEESEQ